MCQISLLSFLIFANSFLDDIDRILSPNYEPSDGILSFLTSFGFEFSTWVPDDIVRARLRTIGIQEHVFKFETGKISITELTGTLFHLMFIGSEVGQEWVIYDVGGSRPQVCQFSRHSYLIH